MSARFFRILIFFSVILFISPSMLFSEERNTQIDTNSQSLVQQAWNAYNEKDYVAAENIADRCVALFDTEARKLQASLKGPIPENQLNRYWQLNDVATAKFIKGKIYMESGDHEKAELIFSDIAKNYNYAMVYDLRGWYWNVAEGVQDILEKLGGGIDFGDGSSSFITTKAWEMYNKREYPSTLAYAEKCIELYKSVAIMQQESLAGYPKKKDISKYWALNDVGTCYYIAGLASLEIDRNEQAQGYFTFITESLSYASCWDTRGWYWKVSPEAKKKLQKLK